MNHGALLSWSSHKAFDGMDALPIANLNWSMEGSQNWLNTSLQIWTLKIQ